MATQNIYQKIHAIQAELPKLAKDGDFDGGVVQYKFLAANDVIAAVRPLLNKHGVFILTKLVNTDIRVFTAEPNGARVPKHGAHLFATYDFEFVSAEDGTSVFTRVLAEAAGSDDKSARKAATSATKIALIQTFSIETGEPDEHELAKPERDEDAAPTAADRKIAAAAAKREAPAKKPAAEKPAANKTAQQVIRDEYIDTGKFTGPALNEMVKAKKEELPGVQSAKIFEAVLADLRAAGE